MAATDCVLVKDSWTATATTEVITASARYEVTVDDQSDGPMTVLSYTGGTEPLPLLYSAWAPGNDLYGDMHCISRSAAKKTEHADIWTVDCEFTNEREEKSDEDGNPTDDPEEWRKELSWGFVSRTRALDNAVWVRNSDNSLGINSFLEERRKQAGPVVNSANQPINPPPEVDDSRMIIRVTKWQKRVNANKLARFKDAINSKPFFIWQFDYPDEQNNKDLLFKLNFDAFQGKIRDILLVPETHTVNGLKRLYYRMTYEILVDVKRGWLTRVPDVGTVTTGIQGAADGRGGSMSSLKAGQAEFQFVIDGQGREVTGPHNLNGWGELNPAGQKPIEMTWMEDDILLDFAELEL